jgi:hypothetical protein
MSRHSRSNHPAGYIFSAVMNGVLLWVMNQLPVWKPFFLLDSYEQVLWAINMSLIVHIALNLVMVFFRPRFFHYLAQTVFNLVSIVSLAWIVYIFPVDFSPRIGDWLNVLFRVVLIIGIVGSAIGVISNFVRFLRALFGAESRRGESGDRTEEE